MKEQLLEAIGRTDEDLLEEVNAARQMPLSLLRRRRILRAVGVCACLAVIAAALAFLPKLNRGGAPQETRRAANASTEEPSAAPECIVQHREEQTAGSREQIPEEPETHAKSGSTEGQPRMLVIWAEDIAKSEEEGAAIPEGYLNNNGKWCTDALNDALTLLGSEDCLFAVAAVPQVSRSDSPENRAALIKERLQHLIDRLEDVPGSVSYEMRDTEAVLFLTEEAFRELDLQEARDWVFDLAHQQEADAADAGAADGDRKEEML